MSFDDLANDSVILDNVENLVCRIADGLVTGINRPGAALLGSKEPADLVGRPFRQFVDPLYHEAVEAFLAGEFEEEDGLPVKMVSVKGAAIEMKLRRLVPAASVEADGKDCVLVGQDVSALIRYGEGLLHSLRRFRDLVSTSLDLKAICQWPRITYINAAGVRMLGGESVNDITGRDLTDFVHANYRLLFEAGPEVLLEEDGVVPAKVVGLDGVERDVQFSFDSGEDGDASSVMVEGRDITAHNKAVAALKDMIENLEEKVDERTFELRAEIQERRKTEELVRYQADYDALTGLPNRNLFFRTLPKCVRDAASRDEILALMFIDLDGFKDVNDLLGHDAGDLLLKQSAQRLTASVRPRDIVSRLGGDEFTIILPGITQTDDIAPIARRVLDTLRTPFDLDGRQGHVSGSVGIACFPEDAEDAEGLVKAGDAAMYLAKNQGKANYQFFTGALRKKEAESQALGRALDRALEAEEFSLLYLPKVSLEDQRVVGVEALLRWKSESLGLVNPDRFIPLLEEKGMISAVGDWVLRTASEHWRTWAGHHDGTLKIGINLSARQLRARNFVDHFMSLLDKAGLPAADVELEITETSVLSQRSRATSVLHELSEAGVGLILDDFGTGYASLRYLHSLPVSAVKIDRTFVDQLPEDPEDKAIARGIITMAHGLGRTVVAEGVETSEQLDVLRDIGCDQAQGYLFAPPLTPEGVEVFLAERNGG